MSSIRSRETAAPVWAVVTGSTGIWTPSRTGAVSHASGTIARCTRMLRPAWTTSRSCENDWCPSACTCKAYSPGGSRPISNSPSESVRPVSAPWRTGPEATTTAPVTGRPVCASTIRPEISPVVCAAAEAARKKGTARQARVMRARADFPMWSGQSSKRRSAQRNARTHSHSAEHVSAMPRPAALTASVRLCRFCRPLSPQIKIREAIPEEVPPMDFSLVGMWKSMGLPARLVVITLAIMSVYSLSVMAERLFSFSRAKDQSRKYAEKLRDLLPSHQTVDAAQFAATMKYGHIPRVLGAGISEYNRGREALRSAGPHDVGSFDLVEAINRALDRATLRVMADLRRGLSGLATVAGIITAFQLMATSGSGGLASVSAGISEALITTAFGLLVAIPALMMYNYLTNRVEEMSVDIADASNELVDFFLKEGRFEEPLTNPGAKPATAPAAGAKA